MGRPMVGIVMGSDSDLVIMEKAAQVLEEFGVEYEMIISSAHRVPHKTINYAETAAERGLEVIIAGAGAAAHLPGVIAAVTPLPIIGVPIDATSLKGLDALYAIVQMPSGIPVATVAINGAKNAGILAVEMLGIKYPELREKILDYKKQLALEVEAKAAKLAERNK